MTIVCSLTKLHRYTHICYVTNITIIKWVLRKQNSILISVCDQYKWVLRKQNSILISVWLIWVGFKKTEQCTSINMWPIWVGFKKTKQYTHICMWPIWMVKLKVLCCLVLGTCFGICYSCTHITKTLTSVYKVWISQ